MRAPRRERLFNRRAVQIAVAILVATAIFSIFAHPPQTGLTLELLDGDTGRLYGAFPVAEGEAFSVSFVHSVNQREVEEFYRVEQGVLYLEACRFYSFGAGMATETGPGEQLRRMEDGSMLLSGLHREMGALSYIVGTVSDHLLSIGDRQYSLRDLCGQNAVVRFVLRRP
ncbi:MAG: DUF1850 domain-containing protein [Clostridiales bacterium]|nr:DUF1850 domain-containing protein [Clostridiales bacterium]